MYNAVGPALSRVTKGNAVYRCVALIFPMISIERVGNFFILINANANSKFAVREFSLYSWSWEYRGETVATDQPKNRTG